MRDRPTELVIVIVPRLTYQRDSHSWHRTIDEWTPSLKSRRSVGRHRLHDRLAGVPYGPSSDTAVDCDGHERGANSRANILGVDCLNPWDFTTAPGAQLASRSFGSVARRRHVNPAVESTQLECADAAAALGVPVNVNGNSNRPTTATIADHDLNERFIATRYPANDSLGGRLGVSRDLITN